MGKTINNARYIENCLFTQERSVKIQGHKIVINVKSLKIHQIEGPLKIVVQRVSQAQVIVDDKIVGEIKTGLLLLVCCETHDDQSIIEKAAAKCLKLRIFEDESAKMNRALTEKPGASILAVSQFTLAWDGRKGHRPSFDGAMAPAQARVLFRIFCDKLREQVHVETGQFGASMQVSLINEGPVTFMLEF